MNAVKDEPVGLTYGGYTSTVASWAVVMPDWGIVGRCDPTQQGESVEFDPRTVLGRKGLRYLSPVSILAGSAVKLALDDVDEAVDVTEVGIVGASRYGHLETVCRAAERFEAGAAGDVSPMELPNASMNVITSTIALRHGIKGVCLTLDSGRENGKDALTWAHRLLRSGRCSRVVVVAAEVASAQEAALRDGPVLLEGAVALVLDRTTAAVRDRGVEPGSSVSSWWSPYSLGALDGPLDAAVAASRPAPALAQVGGPA